MAVVAGVQASLGLQSAAFLSGLKQAAAAMNQLNQTAANTAGGMNKISTSLGNIERSALRARQAFAALGVGFALREISQAVQTFERINSVLLAGTGSAAAAADVI